MKLHLVGVIQQIAPNLDLLKVCYSIISMLYISQQHTDNWGTYRSTLSMDAGSGGGIWKQTPGNDCVEPSGQMMSQFSGSELDLRESLCPLERDSWWWLWERTCSCLKSVRRYWTSATVSVQGEAALPCPSPSRTATPLWWAWWCWFAVASGGRCWCCFSSGQPAAVHCHPLPFPPPGKEWVRRFSFVCSPAIFMRVILKLCAHQVELEGPKKIWLQPDKYISSFKIQTARWWLINFGGVVHPVWRFILIGPLSVHSSVTSHHAYEAPKSYLTNQTFDL